MTINPNRVPLAGADPVTTGSTDAADASGWPTSAGVLARRRALPQLLLYRDAHARHLPACGHDGVLPGRAADPTAAGLPGLRRHPRRLHVRPCGPEGDFFRRGTCARCALRDDLTDLLVHGAAVRPAMSTLLESAVRRRPPREHPNLETHSQGPGAPQRNHLRGNPADP